MNAAAMITVGLLVLAGCSPMPTAPGQRALMLVGNDEKASWDDAGKLVIGAPGKDTVSIVDIGTDPLAPRIVANLPLPNTIIGPPVNLAITPDEHLALVANSMNVVDEGGARKTASSRSAPTTATPAPPTATSTPPA